MLLHEEEEDESVKIMFYLYFIPGVIFSFHFLHTVTFLHVLHLDVLKRQIEIETESENRNLLMYGYNAGPPMAIPIYTVLPYCVISSNLVLLIAGTVVPHNKGCMYVPFIRSGGMVWSHLEMRACQLTSKYQ